MQWVLKILSVHSVETVCWPPHSSYGREKVLAETLSHSPPHLSDFRQNGLGQQSKDNIKDAESMGMDIPSAIREIWRWDRTHFQGLDLEDHRHCHYGPWRWISESPQSRLWPCWFPEINKIGTFQKVTFKLNTRSWMHILHSTASLLWANSLQNAVLNSSIRPILEEISSVEMTTAAPCSILRAGNHWNIHQLPLISQCIAQNTVYLHLTIVWAFIPMHISIILIGWNAEHRFLLDDIRVHPTKYSEIRIICDWLHCKLADRRMTVFWESFLKTPCCS